MDRCMHCNALIEDEARFCGNCGSAVRMPIDVESIIKKVSDELNGGCDGQGSLDCDADNSGHIYALGDVYVRGSSALDGNLNIRTAGNLILDGRGDGTCSALKVSRITQNGIDCLKEFMFDKCMAFRRELHDGVSMVVSYSDRNPQGAHIPVDFLDSLNVKAFSRQTTVMLKMDGRYFLYTENEKQYLFRDGRPIPPKTIVCLSLGDVFKVGDRFLLQVSRG